MLLKRPTFQNMSIRFSISVFLTADRDKRTVGYLDFEYEDTEPILVNSLFILIKIILNIFYGFNILIVKMLNTIPCLSLYSYVTLITLTVFFLTMK